MGSDSALFDGENFVATDFRGFAQILICQKYFLTLLYILTLKLKRIGGENYLLKFMKKLLLLSLLVNNGKISSQTYVMIPDPNFVTYLQGIIPAAMNGNSLNISSPLVTTTTQTLNISSTSISNLSGIQYFTSLNYLDCSYNYLNNLSALPNSVQTLVCNNNSLNTISTFPTSLQTLFCQYNSLTSLPTLPNSITNINCQFNGLTNLPALPNSLQNLNCQYNSLTILPALPNSLQNLNCIFNLLTSLPALPNSLLTLNCGYNYSLGNITTLPNSLQTLICNSNSMTTLPVLSTSIQTLICANNSLTSLPALPNLLQSLYCNGNSLTSLPTLPNSLQILFCNYNNIACFPLFPSSINTIDLLNNPFNCLPNYVLPAMNGYTTTPICVLGNTNGCGVAGIEQITSNNILVLVYPNPSNTQFIIETFSAEKQYLKLFDQNGRILLSQDFNGKTNIDVTNLSQGVYNLTVKTGSNTFNKKLAVTK